MAADVGPAEAEVPPPPWRKQRKAAPAKRPLGQDLIVDTAMRILEREGLDAVSMRRVAQELDTGPASLYAHFSNKDELLEMMLDRVVAQVEIPEPDPGRWEEQLKELARQTQQALVAHADIARVGIETIPTGPNSLRLAEGMLAIMRAGGVPDQIAAWAIDRIHLYIDADAIEGTMLLARARRAGQDTEQFYGEYFGRIHDYFAGLPPERFPHIVRLADKLMAGDGDQRFEFGLDLLVRGLVAHAKSQGALVSPANTHRSDV